MNWDGFLEQLGDWLAARGLLLPAGRWVVGVSGGPDSTLLLYALHALSAERGLNWALHAAHLHHGLRASDADADAAFVQQLADQLGLPMSAERADIRSQIAEHGGSTEEVARQRRYEFLERVALRTGSDCCAVGHHGDDNAETILHRVCRGTGLRGLRGMSDVRAIQPGSRVRLVRPFLPLRRDEIAELCRARQIAFRIDATNESSEFTRGRIRAQVLPLLRDAVNPQVTDALLRLGEQASWLGNYLEDAAARVFDSMVVSEGPGFVAINTVALLGKQRIIQAEIVRHAVSTVMGVEQDISFVHVEAILRLAAERGSGKEVHVPGPVVVRKRYERLEFLPRDAAGDDAAPEFAPVFVQVPGRTTLDAWAADLHTEVLDVDAERIAARRANLNRREEWIDLERVYPPLQIRPRREGDRFHPLGGPGSKSLSDFFIEQKVDPRLRGRIGVLCDQQGPIWVMPLRIDERVKLRNTTRRALRLVLTPFGQAPAVTP